ncbi:DUF932 domain-containing protein [Nonomuraea sp. KM90]|uniref:DUF932 domain-containing protein n=1 Tax=Nonomuraea sp. KM90 TaxID=3457428 RepID=UPI003FCDBB36
MRSFAPSSTLRPLARRRASPRALPSQKVNPAVTLAPPMPPLTVRNACLGDLVNVLRGQHAHKVDVIVPAAQLRAVGTHLELLGTEPIPGPDGVTISAGRYLPTAVCDQSIADKLTIPGAYLRRLRQLNGPLYDANVNGWLRAAPQRRFLFRGLAGQDGAGVGRALLSNSYKVVDNLDALMAALAGIRDAGVDVRIDGGDLSERRMYLRVVCEQVKAYAPNLLRHYRSPFTGRSAADDPLVFAGFVLSNSEVGSGAFTLTARLVALACGNGMTIKQDVMRAVHLGSPMDDGFVRWSDDTHAKNLALITAKARDAVRTFLDVAYVQKKIADLSRDAGTPLSDPGGVIGVVAQRLAFTAEQQDLILDHFIRGGVLSSGGILHAVTSAAQVVADADAAYEMESRGIDAMRLAAATARAR